MPIFSLSFLYSTLNSLLYQYVPQPTQVRQPDVLTLHPFLRETTLTAPDTSRPLQQLEFRLWRIAQLLEVSLLYHLTTVELSQPDAPPRPPRDFARRPPALRISSRSVPQLSSAPSLSKGTSPPISNLRSSGSFLHPPTSRPSSVPSAPTSLSTRPGANSSRDQPLRRTRHPLRICHSLGTSQDADGRPAGASTRRREPRVGRALPGHLAAVRLRAVI